MSASDDAADANWRAFMASARAMTSASRHDPIAQGLAPSQKASLRAPVAAALKSIVSGAEGVRVVVLVRTAADQTWCAGEAVRRCQEMDLLATGPVTDEDGLTLVVSGGKLSFMQDLHGMIPRGGVAVLLTIESFGGWQHAALRAYAPGVIEPRPAPWRAE